MIKNWRRYCILLVLFVVLPLELGPRIIGLVSFPIYELDQDYKYIVKPNQRGAFLNYNDWVINDARMPIASEFTSNQHPNVLLIGNSIVFGGNPYKQSEKLTPLLQQILGDKLRIWPIAAGGWTQENEMAYLKKYPAPLNSADYVVWEYMSGGLSGPTPWAGEYTSPTQKPVVASWYVFWRYVYPWLMSTISVHARPDPHAVELPVNGPADRSNAEAFREFLEGIARHSNHKTRGFIWLFPSRSELMTTHAGMEWLPERRTIEDIARESGLRITDLSKAAEWTETLYKPDGIHPTPEGNHVLAKFLAQEISKDMPVN
jgi:hypothetical protein